ncbi:hypothetical protein ISCGN_008989 [Ixodes scapularis]
MATLSVRAPAAVQLVRPFGYGRVRESTVNAANAIKKTKRRLLKLYVIEFPPVRCRILRSLLPPARKGSLPVRLPPWLHLRRELSTELVPKRGRIRQRNVARSTHKVGIGRQHILRRNEEWNAANSLPH